MFIIALVFTLSGCYRFGARLASSGYKIGTENTLHDCNLFCKTNGCHLFQWIQNKNECRLFDQAVLKGNDTFFREASSMMSIPDCNDEKKIWLKSLLEIQPPTNEECENSKYI